MKMHWIEMARYASHRLLTLSGRTPESIRALSAYLENNEETERLEDALTLFKDRDPAVYGVLKEIQRHHFTGHGYDQHRGKVPQFDMYNAQKTWNSARKHVKKTAEGHHDVAFLEKDGARMIMKEMAKLFNQYAATH